MCKCVRINIIYECDCFVVGNRLFGCGKLKVFQSTVNLQKVSHRVFDCLFSLLSFYELALMKELVSDPDSPTPLSYFSPLFIVVQISYGFTHCPLNHDDYCLLER